MGRAAPLALVLALLVLSLAGAHAGDPVPWPGGIPPADLDAALHDALVLAERERGDEILEASERGEDREHFDLAQADIDLGLYDLDRLFRAGDTLFAHPFDLRDGLGAGSTLAPPAPVHAGVRGGRDGFSCAGCHAAGGPDGAGNEPERAFVDGDGVHTSSALVRDAPAVLGLGLVQALGDEMTRALRFAADEAAAMASAERRDVTIALETHGVSFGALTVHPDGSWDTTAVEGVDADLVVRPFGWKGEVARLRRFAEEAARIHFGIQSHVLALAHRDMPDPDRLGDGPNWWDPDGDGVTRELDDGALTSVAVYLALLESPVVIPPSTPELFDAYGRGAARFQALGCGGCHRDTLVLRGTSWTELPDTTGGAGVTFNLIADGERPRGSSAVRLFSDLRRHDMGESLADPHDAPSGVDRRSFLTRPLWGLADTAPYLHDGRAATIDEAITLHDGEAAAARDAYLALPHREQRELIVFLSALTRAPRPRVLR